MMGDVITVHLHVEKIRRLAAALDLYAVQAELVGDDIEAKYARGDRDIIRQYLLDGFGYR